MAEGRPVQIDLAKLYALITPAFGRASGGGGSQPDPDNPMKPGPWDPYIRVALKEVIRFGPSPQPWFGPQPEPWLSAAFGNDLLQLIARRFPAVNDVIGGILRPGDLVSLNPQPLPPVERFVVALGEALVARVEVLAEVSAAFADVNGGEERSIIIVGGKVSRLIDDYCGTDFRHRWPFPGPPPWWFKTEVDGRDLLVLGATLNAAAERSADPIVRQVLGDASGKLAEVGVERLG